MKTEVEEELLDNKTNEKILISRITQGDKNAFRELFDEYKDKVYSICMRMLRNKNDAEDTAQDIFLRIYKSIAGFRQDSSLATWIHRISINSCMDRLNKRKKENQIDNIDNVDLTSLTDKKNNMEFSTKEIIDIAIGNLPEKSRIIFLLKTKEELKHEEIADIMDISIGTSKSQFFNAKALLRKQLLPLKEELTNEM